MFEEWNFKIFCMYHILRVDEVTFCNTLAVVDILNLYVPSIVSIVCMHSNVWTRIWLISIIGRSFVVISKSCFILDINIEKIV